jgi:hypothetical protein
LKADPDSGAKAGTRSHWSHTADYRPDIPNQPFNLTYPLTLLRPS